MLAIRAHHYKCPRAWLYTTTRICKRAAMPKLTEEERTSQLRDLLEPPFNWQLTKDHPSGEAIKRTYRFRNFDVAFDFMTTIAEKAKNLNHHPEWFNVWNKVEIILTTHDANGLSKKDLEMASFIACQADKFGAKKT